LRAIFSSYLLSISVTYLTGSGPKGAEFLGVRKLTKKGGKKLNKLSHSYLSLCQCQLWLVWG
jgi:hypothetical protein